MDWGSPVTYIIPALALIGAIFAIGTWVGGMNTFRNTVGDTIKEIRDDIKKLLERLPAKPIAPGRSDYIDGFRKIHIRGDWGLYLGERPSRKISS